MHEEDRTAVPLSEWSFDPATKFLPSDTLRTRWADAYGDYYTMKMATRSVPMRKVRVIQKRDT